MNLPADADDAPSGSQGEGADATGRADSDTNSGVQSSVDGTAVDDGDRSEGLLNTPQARVVPANRAQRAGGAAKTTTSVRTKSAPRSAAGSSSAAKAREARARAAKAEGADSSSDNDVAGGTVSTSSTRGASPAARTSKGAAAPKSAPRRTSSGRKVTAPKPASQAASVVASTTLAARQSVADDVVKKWSSTEDESPDVSAEDDALGVGVGAETAIAETADAETAVTATVDAEAGDAEAGVSDQTGAESRAVRPAVAEQHVTAVTDQAGAAVTALTEQGAGAATAVIDDSERAEHSGVRDRVAAASVHEKVGRPAAADDALHDSDRDRAESERSEATARETVTVLVVEGLSKSFDGNLAVDSIDLSVRAGSIFGIVGPNGAGKTTTLSMVTGLLRPDAGRILVHGADVWKDPVTAKRNMGVLPDRLRLFDRLTGGQLLFYSGSLRGLDRATVRSRSADLAVAFGLEDALSRLVTDYSAGMTKKIALAAAMIHSPRLLILDEPFEAVDPVSAANVIEILQKYAAAGGTVVMSSHSMDLIQRICDSVTIIVRGEALASGTMEDVRGDGTLEDRFVQLAGGRKAAEGMEWLHSFSG